MDWAGFVTHDAPIQYWFLVLYTEHALVKQEKYATSVPQPSISDKWWRRLWSCMKWPLINFHLRLLIEIPVAVLLPMSHSLSSLFLKFDSCSFGTWRSEAAGWVSPLLSFTSVPTSSSSPPTPVSSLPPWDTGKVKGGHTAQTHDQLYVHCQWPVQPYQNLFLF